MSKLLFVLPFLFFLYLPLILFPLPRHFVFELVRPLFHLSRRSWRQSLARLARFNLTTGGVSIVGNLALMPVMVGVGHMNYLVANGIAIALCSLANFLVIEEWVFAGD